MQLSLTSLRSATHELRRAIERGEVVELTFHGKVIGQVNPAEKKNHTLDERVVNAYFNRREGDDPYAAIEQLKQGRKGRDETLYTANYRDFHFIDVLPVKRFRPSLIRG